MEFNISDLLDDLQDDSVELRPQNAASGSRIKELTMEKIKKQKKPPRRGVRTLGRAVLVAAVVVMLATTVLAASGFRIADWINRERGGGFDEDVFYGSGSMSWEVGGRTFRLSVEMAAPSGATLAISDLEQEYVGELSDNGEFWLEQWDGDKYVPLEPKAGTSWSDQVTVLPYTTDTVRLELDWEESYGALPSGYYRIGKYYTLTTDSGEVRRAACYAKFRLYTGEMEPYLDKCRAALDGLLAEESYHLSYICYPSIYRDLHYTYIAQEIWKDGGDFLEESRYVLEAGQKDELVDCRGLLFRDTVGFSLEWEGDSPERPVSRWDQAAYVSESSFDNWLVAMNWYETIVGEVSEDNGRIVLLSQNSASAEYPYSEHILTFDEQEKLVRIEKYCLPQRDCEAEEKRLCGILEVLDTSGAEIREMIDGQDVTTPNSFSWAEDQTVYPEAQRDGFVNTAVQRVDGWEDAARIAKADCSLTDDPAMADADRYYNIVTVFWDESAGIWKVVFSNAQDDYSQAVYLDEQGVTQMVVKVRGT